MAKKIKAMEESVLLISNATKCCVIFIYVFRFILRIKFRFTDIHQTTDIDGEAEKHRNDIQSAFKQLHQSLDERESVLLSKLNQLVAAKKSNLLKAANTINAKKAESQRKLNECELKVTKPTKIHELDSRIQEISGIATEIENVEVVTEDHDAIQNKKINVTLNSESVVAAVASFGSVSVGLVPDENKEDDAPNNQHKDVPLGIFDVDFNENGYYILSNDKRTATFAKGGLPGIHDYGSYPAIKIARPIIASDAKSQMVKFRFEQYGWFGIGSDSLVPHGFPGYTDSGWMIRITDGQSWHKDVSAAMGFNHIENMINEQITMKYNPSSKQLTVITTENKQYHYTHKDMPTSGKAYFVFTMASGKVQLFDTE